MAFVTETEKQKMTTLIIFLICYLAFIASVWALYLSLKAVEYIAKAVLPKSLTKGFTEND